MDFRQTESFLSNPAVPTNDDSRAPGVKMEIPGVRRMRHPLLFLTWECPWPATWGGAVRALGLLEQLGAFFDVELILLTRQPLSAQQERVLNRLCRRVTRLRLRGGSRVDQVRMGWRSLARLRPYHCTVVQASFDERSDVLERIRTFPGLVYASYGHWGTLVHGRSARNWILDQQHAAADFWRVYGKHASNPFVKAAARMNRSLAAHHFKDVYPGLGRVVSVCNEDKELTLALSPSATVEVIENGVDCAYYVPHRTATEDHRTILFIGTEEHRNMAALRRFARRILPLVRHRKGDVRLAIAGDVGDEAQKQFNEEHALSFTGPMDDLREAFRASTLFVVPHEDTHGSQLKVALAMAMGMPIVSTPNGIRGLPLVNGESVLIGDDDERFAEHVCTLLDDRGLRTSLGASARIAAETHLDWPVLSRRLVALIEDVAEECRQGTPLRRFAIPPGAEPSGAELAL